MISLLTKQALAERFSISPKTLDKLRKKGLPYYNIGRSVRFNETEVEAWLEEKRKERLTKEQQCGILPPLLKHKTNGGLNNAERYKAFIIS